MLENLEQELKSWDWKWQTIWSYTTWEKWPPVSVILNRLESNFYVTKEVEIDLSVINLTNYSFEVNDLFQFMTHYKLVENADLQYPVILNKKWVIIDWRHRLCKAILQWDKKLKWIMIMDSEVY